MPNTAQEGSKTMIEYRNSFGSDAVTPVKDFPLNAAYAAAAKKNDIVTITAGEVVAATAASTTILGVYQGPTLQHPTDTVKKGKVMDNPQAVYEVSYVGGTPAVGATYAMSINADGTGQMNVAATTPAIFRVHELLSNGHAMVSFNKASLIM
jgi:hypothetical protein